jgi:hypothetical protein
VKAADEVSAKLLIGMDDDLGIATCGEAMASVAQLGSQFTEVVDLPVQYDDD